MSLGLKPKKIFFQFLELTGFQNCNKRFFTCGLILFHFIYEQTEVEKLSNLLKATQPPSAEAEDQQPRSTDKSRCVR